MDSLCLLKARVWNAGVLLWWYRLWIRSDEFDKSLSLDDLAYRVKGEQHYHDLQIRRRIAHERDLRGIKSNWQLILRDIIGYVIPTSGYKRTRATTVDVDTLLQTMDELAGQYK